MTLKIFTAVFILLGCIACNMRRNGNADSATGETISHNDKPAPPYGLQDNATGSDIVKKFVPGGYIILDSFSGNLNLDAYADMILVLKQPGEDTLEMNFDEPVKRPLLILTGKEGGDYILAGRNDNAVLCRDCAGMFGDAFYGITIKDGYFSIEHVIAGGRHWQSVTTFKYNKEKADWYLYKEGYESYRMNDDTSPDAEALVKDVESQKTVKDFGVVPFGKYNTYTEE